MNKYLVFAPSWIGDMIMSQSLYKILKKIDKNFYIDIATSINCCELIKFMPEINNFIILEFNNKDYNFKKKFLISKIIKKKNYSHSIILKNSWKSAIIPILSKIKIRIGWKGEQRFLLINDIRNLKKNIYPLMIQRFCFLAIKKNKYIPKILPYPKLKINNYIKNKIIRKHNIEKIKNITALCIGGEYGPSKKWPIKYFIKIINFLIKKKQIIILIGGIKDIYSSKKICEYFKKTNKINILNLVNKTNITDAIYIISKCKRIISNDSGLMHISCSLKIPTIVIYGSTSKSFTPPLNKKSKNIFLKYLKCRPCFKRECFFKHLNCMNKLKPEKVIRILKKYN